MTSCTEKFGNKVEGFISGNFNKLGKYTALKPRRTIACAIILTALCGAGFARWSTENRADKLWVPQNTVAEAETEDYQKLYGSSSRFNSIIIQADIEKENVLTKARLEDAMKMHGQIETSVATVDDKDYTFAGTNSLCTASGASCANIFDGVCKCLVLSILKQWNYDLTTLQNDADYMTTLNAYGSEEDLRAVLGNPLFESENVVSAESFTLSYFINDRSAETTEEDPINEAWEKDVFLAATTDVPDKFSSLSVDYIAGRSFADEFGGAITGDLLLVQISYVVVFLFLGATMGRFIPGPESRWTMALAALVLVGLSTGAGFGLASAMGLFFGPVHSLLPFILLGIGVDDAFVIVNAFNRERKGPRSKETNEDIAERAARAMGRAGASITVTSMTDLVAFRISASSSLPALASFSAYAAIGIVFLWIFASTFFSATLVLDERRQRDNRRECLCCLTRNTSLEEDEDDKFEEGRMSRYFRNVHAPLLLTKAGKAIVLLAFTGLLAFGIYGTLNLSVENTQRAFIPSGSYLTEYINAADEYYPTAGLDLNFLFEGSSDIYSKRAVVADLAIGCLVNLLSTLHC